MALIRAVIGFLFFELLFWLRENHYNNVWIGVVIGALDSRVDARQRPGSTAGGRKCAKRRCSLRRSC